jgi:hypothetical protein
MSDKRVLGQCLEFIFRARQAAAKRRDQKLSDDLSGKDRARETTGDAQSGWRTQQPTQRIHLLHALRITATFPRCLRALITWDSTRLSCKQIEMSRHGEHIPFIPAGEQHQCHRHLPGVFTAASGTGQPSPGAGPANARGPMNPQIAQGNRLCSTRWGMVW